MKPIVFTLCLLASTFASASTIQAQAGKKHYLSPQDLAITEQGIFVKTKNGIIPVGELAYDYEARSFYVGEALCYRRVLVKCGYCSEITWDPDDKVCYNPDCPYYAF